MALLRLLRITCRNMDKGEPGHAVEGGHARPAAESTVWPFFLFFFVRTCPQYITARMHFSRFMHITATLSQSKPPFAQVSVFQNAGQL